MADGQHSKRLSLDTNVLLDIAAGYDFAVGFRDTFQKMGYSLHCVPTVLAELNALMSDEDEETRKRATTALDNLILWDISPITLTDAEKKYRTNFINIADARNVLPDGEINDARILSETAIANIPVLVTSDTGILDADQDALALAFNDSGLLAVRVLTAYRLWKTYFKPSTKKKR